MPVYEYRCEDCGTGFEVQRPVNQRDVSLSCPQCGSGKIRRRISRFIAFGTGEDGRMNVLGGSLCSSCPLADCSACTLPRRQGYQGEKQR